MLKRVVVMGVIMLLPMGTIVACSVLRAPTEASSSIEAIPLVMATNTPPAFEMPATETAGTATSTESTVATMAETAAENGQAIIFRINPATSQVRFELDEDLRGQRKTVVGITDQIAGEVAVNFSDLSQTQIGVIQINARTLVTDNNLRNRAIHNEILDTNRYEFITFTPTAVNDLPPSVNVGEMITFTITGELTIRDIVQPATFTVDATAVSATQITGKAYLTINRDAYGLSIPSVPGVANVEQEVEIHIDFVADEA